MAYVKLAKADGAFDILPAENVGSVKLSTDTKKQIDVTYMGADSSTDTISIVPVGSGATASFEQSDVQALVKAIGTIGGGAGMISVDLSKVVDSTSVGGS